MKKRRTKRSLNSYDPETRFHLKVSGPRQSRQHASNHNFPRIYNRRSYATATEFSEAGYPMAALPSGAPWQQVHQWCGEVFRNAKGRTYTWTGSTFWFQTEADRDLFASRWSSPST